MQLSQDTLSDQLSALHKVMTQIRATVVIDEVKLELILAALLARGHVLLEDIPGIGKTMIAKALARSMHAAFKRIQCTPDLLPSDITGGAIYNQRDQSFEFVPGPIFANLVLVDEINRASPRTQSSLLEAMAEGQVTSDNHTRQLPDPFLILATQNPIEMAGTFPLPEAQLDRFLISLNLGYPSRDDEIAILEREEHANPLDNVQPLLEMADIALLQQQARTVRVARSLKDYIVQINTASRTHPDVVLGLSPRAGVALQRCAQALAFIRARDYVNAQDIKDVLPAVAIHRILPRNRRRDTAQAILDDLLTNTPVPVE